MPMIEHVARAIAESNGLNWGTMPDRGGGIAALWSRAHFLKLARAAIEAMRDLNDDMAEAIAYEAGCCGGIAHSIWVGAIDAALKEPSL